MNILFLTLVNIKSIEERGIYQDLLREFRKNGHTVYVAAPTERRNKEKTTRIKQDGCEILKVKTGNLQKVNIIEKGISTLLLEGQFIKQLKKHFKDVKFDLVMYSTPPITFAKVVKFIKKRDGAKSYLLLKDIFPQNAVDIGMLRTSGLKGLIFRFFRAKERKLYAFSDKIGCMSKANCEYVLRHNPEIPEGKVEVCPNSVEFVDMRVSEAEAKAMREKYGVPTDKKVFVYGGNLGRPQGIPFLIDCLRSQKDNGEAFFVIAGAGTEFCQLQAYVDNEQPTNVKLLSYLPKEDYDKLVAACDIGMIFLDHRFTIPNFPSRLLSYMQAGLPVLVCSDPNTDVGDVVQEGGFGWKCMSDDVGAFAAAVREAAELTETEYTTMQESAIAYLKEHYTVDRGYEIIMQAMGER